MPRVNTTLNGGNVGGLNPKESSKTTIERGQFGGYVASPNLIAQSVSGTQTVTNDNAMHLYNGGGSTVAGGIGAQQVELGRLAIFGCWTTMDYTAGDPQTSGRWNCFEGTGASQTDATATAFSQWVNCTITTANSRDHGGCYFNMSADRPAAGRASEWGVNFRNSTLSSTLEVRGEGATFVGFPVYSSLAIGDPQTAIAWNAGGTIGKQAEEWDVADAGSIDPNNVKNDVSGTVTDTFNVGREGDYLLWWNCRVESGSTASTRSLRWHFLLDGVDAFGVNTDTATSGAVKTGRGFQCSYPTGESTQLFFGSIQVKHLKAGSHTAGFKCNKHENVTGTSEAFSALRCHAIDTRVFSQFEYTAITGLKIETTNSWANTPGIDSLKITTDGTAPIMIVFSSSYHIGTNSVTGGGYPEIRITRNGNAITPNGTSGPNAIPIGIQVPSLVPDGAASTQDSDNATLPYAFVWIDNPGAGTYTYRVQSQLATSGTAYWNCNDNGAAGFTGLFAAAELKLAQWNYHIDNV